MSVPVTVAACVLRDGFLGRLGRDLSTLCVETVLLLVLRPALVELLELGIRDDAIVLQGEQGRPNRDTGDVGPRGLAARGAPRLGRLDPPLLADLFSFLRHARTEICELFPGHRPRPRRLQLGDHLRKPDSLRIACRHQPQSSQSRLLNHVSAVAMVSDALGLIVW